MSQNEESQIIETDNDVHPIPSHEDMPAPKPKRVLTEAQKLAFMKGREKRAANIQQRKLEKQQEQQHPDVIPTTPPQSKKAPPPDVDYDLLADKLAERLSAKQKPSTPPITPPPKKRGYTRRVGIDTTPPPPPPPPPPRAVPMPALKRNTTDFNWM